MKWMRKNLGLVFFLAIWLFSCEKAEETEEPIDISGSWDLTIFDADPAQSNYLIEVSLGGASGTAQVKVYNNFGDDSGPSVVNVDVPVPLGTCGVNVIFSDSTDGPLNLVSGDRWRIAVVDGVVYEPKSDPKNKSVARITTSGTYTCLTPTCTEGLYNSLVPLAYDVKVDSSLREYEILQLKVNQNDANFTSAVPEEHILSLWLIGLTRQKSVELCYKKKLQAKGGSNYFRVRLADLHRYLLLDNNAGEQFNCPKQNVCVRFEPQVEEVRIDFIFGLTNFNSVAWLDQIQAKIAGTIVFSYDFESGSLDNDLTPPKNRWQLRSPNYEHGDAMVSNIKPLEGNFSFRVVGGRNLELSGSVLEQASTDIATILGQVPGMNIRGLLFEIYEDKPGGYFSSLSGALQGKEAIIGTFTGEKGGCREQGQFITAVNQGKIYPIDRLWTLRLVGNTENCPGVGRFREAFVPFRPVQKADRFYSEQSKPVVDRYGNFYQLNGREVGTALYFILEDYDELDFRNALFSGIVNRNPEPEEEDGDTTEEPPPPNIAGSFNGWLGFKNQQKCRASGTFTVFFPRKSETEEPEE